MRLELEGTRTNYKKVLAKDLTKDVRDSFFHFCRFENLELRGYDLRNCDFIDCEVINCDLTDAKLDYIVSGRTKWTGSIIPDFPDFTHDLVAEVCLQAIKSGMLTLSETKIAQASADYVGDGSYRHGWKEAFGNFVSLGIDISDVLKFSLKVFKDYPTFLWRFKGEMSAGSWQKREKPLDEPGRKETLSGVEFDYDAEWPTLRANNPHYRWAIARDIETKLPKDVHAYVYRISPWPRVRLRKGPVEWGWWGGSGIR